MKVRITATIQDFGTITWPEQEIPVNGSALAEAIGAARVNTRKAFGCNWTPTVKLKIICM